LRGTPILYAGDEIGVGNVPIPPKRVRDPFERRVPGYGLNRDPSRTPMRWDASPSAGFTSCSDPWLPIGDDVAGCNVAVHCRDERSLLALYCRLLTLRREEAALLVGSWEAIPGGGEVLAYWRCLPRRKILVALNLGDGHEEVRFAGEGEVRLSTHLDRQGERAARTVWLRPHEGIILEALC
jgi:alpha-glucosidase